MAVKILAQRLSKNASYGLNFLLKRAINTTNAFENVMAKSTVDQVDVENHAKLTKDWWDLKGPAMPLHSYNFVRVPFIQNALGSYEPHHRTFTPLKGKSILDIGCGGGILSEKDVINFLIVRRYDLNSDEDLIRYIAIRPHASIASLRQKIWHLLDLPDYCDEVIVLKTNGNVKIPLTELRNGNEPNRPFILEVWPPEKGLQPISQNKHSNMLTMGQEDFSKNKDLVPQAKFSHREKPYEKCTMEYSTSTIINEKTVFNKRRNLEKPPMNYLPAEFKKRELSKRISNSSLFIKLQGKKNKDNLTNVILKIQNELSNLSDKLTNLENKIPDQN